MLLIGICIVIIFWVLYMSIKFYRSTDWNEPAESSPDFGEMRKKEAQLLHVQEVLEEACESGKLSKNTLDEYTHYADAEIAQMERIRQEWDERKKDHTPTPHSN